ncbi:O-antigen ligase family protein [Micromonospora sp. NPDC050397]|uniref:O-antigen ligase family protein n=1 Tax=Micromonospora sp. NPDC050397 TaxID=3364279 RepID=UPI00384AC840
MIAARVVPPGVLIAGAAGGVAVVLPLVGLPGDLGLTAACGVLCLIGFTLWPWAVLPFGIIGGTIAGVFLGDGGIRSVIIMHTLILLTGCAAVVVRRMLLPGERPKRTSTDTAMLALAALTALAAIYGLVRGNVPMYVIVAAYQISIIPGYFFVATHTLADARSLRAAGLLYLGTATVLTAAELATPGRHGGLLSSLALPPLMVLVGRTRGWRRIALVLVAAGFAADVVLASYRSIWLAAGLAVAIMVIRGGPVIRRGVATTAAVGILLLALLSLSAGVRERALVITSALGRSAGHRAPEASVGVDVFSTQPFAGAGLGQSTQGIYLPGMGMTDVGPIYHAFYVLVLANLGLIGLCAVLWPVLRTLRVGFAERDGMPLAFAALTCGFLLGAFFAGPTEGHWELGLLPALTLLTARATGLSNGRVDLPAAERVPQTTGPPGTAPPSAETWSGQARPRELVRLTPSTVPGGGSVWVVREPAVPR